MKIIAFYLPQFHTIPENDKWWGKGFTEWINTKKAKPLFAGHYQPREPLDDNYYDLSNVAVMKGQASLAKEHGIYGFCYYHYWFNGKKLLEKPLENMLQHKDVDIPFCLSWANEPWTRAWDGGEKDVLMPQKYGSKVEWGKHFEYLLGFFKDDRYIKIENKPMLLIYRTSNVENVNEMVEYWNNLAVKHGFSGMHIVETMNSFQRDPSIETSRAVLEFEPMYTMVTNVVLKKKMFNPAYLMNNRIKIKNKILDKIYNLFYNKPMTRINYDSVWQEIISRKRFRKKTKEVYLGAFVNWDNTARKGSNGVAFRNFSIEKFKFYLSKQVENAKRQNQEFIFINAWNEWAEGTYLEPDKKYGNRYLEAVKDIVSKYTV